MKMLFALSLLLLGVAHAAPSMTIKATPVLMQQLKIMAIDKGQMHDLLRLPARVELDGQRVARIGTTVTGRITETHAELGQDVKKGERLATLNSTELGLAQSAYLKTTSQVNLHRLATERARRLFASDVIAASQLQERESQLNEAEVDLRTAADQLRVLGMSDADLARLANEKKIHSMLPVTTSIRGTIVERNVTVGQVVQPADALFTVADLSQVWVVAALPEQEAHWAHKGDEALVTVSALPSQEIAGRLVYVADLVDPQTRTVTVRMALPNPERTFKPHMLATLVIRKHIGTELVLPDSAIIRVDDRDHVFVQADAQEFELRPVQLGHRHGEMREVVQGLKNGDKIVVEGGFHLNNERQRQELE